MQKFIYLLMGLALMTVFLANAYAEDEYWTFCDAQGPFPDGRWCHTAIHDVAHERMIIYGGCNIDLETLGDLWALDGNTLEWIQLEPINEGPNVLRSHTAIYDPADTSMVVFGGVTYPGGDIINDVWILNLNSLSWEHIEPDSTWPPPTRCLYAVYRYEYDQMLIFGGRLHSRYDDTWLFNLDNHTWDHVEYYNDGPAPREGSPIALIRGGSTLLVCGGYDSGPEYYDELWSLDIDRGLWTQYSPQEPHPMARGYNPFMYDKKSDRVLFFGGFTAYPGPGMDDLWEIDLSTMEYRELLAGGEIPHMRGRHTAIVGGFAGHKATIFGGAHNYDIAFNDVYFLDWDILVSADDDTELPAEFFTLESYPNPFNTSATIRYNLPADSYLKVEIYNLMGQRVAMLYDGTQQAGEHSVTWDTADFPSGIYFARLEVGGRFEMRKMVLLK